MRADDLLGAIWLPGDGTANPTDLTQALARGARHGGAQVVEQVRVLDVLVGPTDAVTGVRTDRGDVEAEVVVNCAGQWASPVGDHGRRHGPAALRRALLRRHRPDRRRHAGPADPARPRRLHLRQGGGRRPRGRRLRAARPSRGCSPHGHPLPVRVPAPRRGLGALLGPDGQRAAPRSRRWRETGIRKFYNGPESFTPDNQFLLGQAPGLRSFFVGAGFNSVGIASAGGAGRALAEWIVDGEPTTDLTAVDLRRFAPFHGNSRWLRDRVGEVLGLHYADPVARPGAARPARPFRRLAVARRARRRRAPASAAGWAGSGPTVFAPAGFEADLDYAWDRPALAAVVAPRSTRRPGGQSLSSTRRRSRSTSSRAPTRGRPAVAVHRGRRRAAPGRASTPAAQRPRHLRVRRHRHPTGRRRSSSWSAARRPPSATRTTSADTCHPTARDGRRRPDLGVRRARGDGAALARRCWPGSPDADLADGFPFATSRRSTSGTPRCGRPG